MRGCLIFSKRENTWMEASHFDTSARWEIWDSTSSAFSFVRSVEAHIPSMRIVVRWMTTPLAYIWNISYGRGFNWIKQSSETADFLQHETREWKGIVLNCYAHSRIRPCYHSNFVSCVFIFFYCWGNVSVWTAFFSYVEGSSSDGNGFIQGSIGSNTKVADEVLAGGLPQLWRPGSDTMLIKALMLMRMCIRRRIVID